jgi:hypothetical protein
MALICDDELRKRLVHSSNVHGLYPVDQIGHAGNVGSRRPADASLQVDKLASLLAGGSAAGLVATDTYIVYFL